MRAKRGEALAWLKAVQPSEECIVWPFHRPPGNAGGYGYIKLRSQGMGAHRASWLLHRGSIPDGLHVLHSCDNPPCVNPAHLFLGTNAENVKDMVSKGRLAPQAGENNRTAKLTYQQVLAIRSDPRRPQRVIAEDYGVSQGLVSAIKLGKAWKGTNLRRAGGTE